MFNCQLQGNIHYNKNNNNYNNNKKNIYLYSKIEFIAKSLIFQSSFFLFYKGRQFLRNEVNIDPYEMGRIQHYTSKTEVRKWEKQEKVHISQTMNGGE